MTANPHLRRVQQHKVQKLTGIDAMMAMNPTLAKPLSKALKAMEAGNLPSALKHFSECAEIDETNKAVLYFGSQAAQQGYYAMKYRDPPADAQKVEQWRMACRTLAIACAEADRTDPLACHNAGRFLQDDGAIAESLEWYYYTLSLKRDMVETWGNLGTALYDLGKVTEAEAAWTKCVTFEATTDSGFLAQAYVWLRRGDYARGWKALNHRLFDDTFNASYGRKDLAKGAMWTGQPLKKSDRLLVHGEQGLGDHVMFARYIPTLIERGIHVAAIETRPPLKTWMEACFPDIPVVMRGELDTYPHFSHQAPFISLPGLLGLTDPIQPTAPLVERATRHIGKRVGIVWQGARGNSADWQRSIKTEQLAMLADIPGVTWVPLQYDPSGTLNLEAGLWLGSNVEPLTEPFTDVLGMAQAMRDLDLVITIDSLPAHVAGSLSVPVWILHRFNREWRWQQHTEECNWYPSAVNLTCPQPDDWTSLLQQVRERLLRTAPPAC